MKALIEQIYAAVSTGDLDNVINTLIDAQDQARELFKNIKSDKSREILKKQIVEIEKLVEQLNAKSADLDDVLTFIKNTKEIFNRRVAEQPKEA